MTDRQVQSPKPNGRPANARESSDVSMVLSGFVAGSRLQGFSDVWKEVVHKRCTWTARTLATGIALVAALVLLLIASAHAHVPGCHSRKCDRRVHRHRALHWCHSHAGCLWRHRWAHVDPGLKARLARLRWCESTNNYRAVNGQYTGAYQYAASTWARAGGSGLAMNAPPREQDVRTAWFFPTHVSEWECRA